MDALMAALIAGVLAQLGDRPAWLAAILADRYRRVGVVIAAAALALLGAGLIACAGGLLLRGKLTPEAGQLFLALALMFQGAGGLTRAKLADRLDRWRLGAFGTTFLGLFILLFGDGLQFIVLALVARSALPWAAVIGAVIGALAVIAAAALVGERNWTALSQSLLRRVASVLFLVAGTGIGLSALRLI